MMMFVYFEQSMDSVSCFYEIRIMSFHLRHRI